MAPTSAGVPPSLGAGPDPSSVATSSVSQLGSLQRAKPEPDDPFNRFDHLAGRETPSSLASCS